MAQYLDLFRERISITRFLSEGQGLVAGLLHQNQQGGWELTDSTGSLALGEELVQQLELCHRGWVALEFSAPAHCRIRYRGESKPPAEHERILDSRQVFQKRWAVHRAIRDFFHSRDFIEVDTPVRVPCPGMEPYLDAFEAEGAYLRTSPELHMKRLLADGFDKIFQIGPCFRANERGRFHRDEFLMLEWYRAFADLGHIERDLAELLADLSTHANEPAFFRQPLLVKTCAQLFQSVLNLRLADHSDREPLRNCHNSRGLSFDPDDDWDTLFFRLYLNFIEPHLGAEQPTLVTQFPASQAALAKIAPQDRGGMPYCYRLELYVKGVELANAFYELTDPIEQRKRFQGDLAERARLGKRAYPLDEAFLGALESGLPPSAGIALGVDRLVAVLLGKSSLDEVLPFG